MSSLDRLNQRLQYRGGRTEGRMSEDKLHSLRAAMFNSYQAETIILPDGREFKCLINPNKETGDYDNKILSIPYEDVCLNEKPGSRGKTTQGGRQKVGLKMGDVVTWKETDTKWILFLQYLEEEAYLRTQIRKCETSVDINGQRYWVYIRGPVETSIQWNQKAGVEWNDLNYSLVLYITKDQNTIDFFHRHQKIKVPEYEGAEVEKTWVVVDENRFYGDGIIEVYLDEAQENSLEEAAAAERLAQEKRDCGCDCDDIDLPDPDAVKIEGPAHVTMYDTVTYSLVNSDMTGDWYVIDERGNTTQLVLDTKQVAFTVNRTRDKYYTLVCEVGKETIELVVTIDRI